MWLGTPLGKEGATGVAFKCLVTSDIGGRLEHARQSATFHTWVPW